MGILIKEKHHYYTRVPIGLGIIIIFGLSPFILGFSGAWIYELITQEICHEGNCFWGVIPWFGMITIPLGIILMILFFIIIVIDSFSIIKK